MISLASRVSFSESIISSLESKRLDTASLMAAFKSIPCLSVLPTNIFASTILAIASFVISLASTTLNTASFIKIFKSAMDVVSSIIFILESNTSEISSFIITFKSTVSMSPPNI